MRAQMPDPIPQPGPIPFNDPPPMDDPPLELPPITDPMPTPLPTRMQDYGGPRPDRMPTAPPIALRYAASNPTPAMPHAGSRPASRHAPTQPN